MATAVARPKLAIHVPGRRYDHVFFAATVALMVVTVVVGFGPTYYFAGFLRASLPSTIVHVHAVLFSAWMLLLVTQSILVSAHRVDIHRRLGIAGCVLAIAMVLVGVLAATDSMMRTPRVPGRDPRVFYIVPLSNMVMFSGLMIFAYRKRRDSAAHKRLILLATTALMLAAVTRWPVAMIHMQTVRATVVSDVFLLALVAYDVWALRRVHRATMWGGLFVVLVQLIRMPIGKTAAWYAFATWAQAAYR
jgi:FtsH-binding integral membrane protein